jgi:AmmeMemoRadiSam system protein B
MSAITIVRRKWTSLSVASLAVAAVLPLAFAAAMQVRGDPAGGSRSAASAAPVHRAEFFDQRQFALAVRSVEARPPQPMPGARAIIVPHHWTAGSLIVGPLRDLAATREVRRVILIGPNHTNSGGATVITSDGAWSTPFGAVRPDVEVGRSLVSNDLAAFEPDVLTYEHSVGGIVPAIRYYLHEASIVPLIIKSMATEEQLRSLVEALAPFLDKFTVIVAAVDFSHGLQVDVARGKNAETRLLLKRMASSELLRLGNEHLDSPASVGVAIEASRRAGAHRFELLADATSAEFAPGQGEVTAYLVGYFH